MAQHRLSWLATLVGFGMLACLTGSVAFAQALKGHYDWVGRLVSVDANARTVTVKVPLKDHVTKYINQFKPGDRVVTFWGSPKPGETDAILYVGAYDTAKPLGDDYGYVMPVEFVSFDAMDKTATVKAYLQPQGFASFASIQAGRWVKVTSP